VGIITAEERKKKAMKKGSWKHQTDEHNTPTEPLPPIPALFEPAPGDYIPAETPFPPYVHPQFPLNGYPYNQPPSSHLQGYPYYPIIPGTPPETTYVVWPADTAGKLKITSAPRTRRRWFLPACVGLLFFCLQLLLITRFATHLFGLSSADLAWLGVVTAVSDIFVQPFRELWLQFPSLDTFLPTNVELYTVIAILVYGLLARVLKAILKGR